MSTQPQTRRTRIVGPRTALWIAAAFGTAAAAVTFLALHYFLKTVGVVGAGGGGTDGGWTSPVVAAVVAAGAGAILTGWVFTLLAPSRTREGVIHDAAP